VTRLFGNVFFKIWSETSHGPIDGALVSLFNMVCFFICVRLQINMPEKHCIAWPLFGNVLKG